MFGIAAFFQPDVGRDTLLSVYVLWKFWIWDTLNPSNIWRIWRATQKKVILSRISRFDLRTILKLIAEFSKCDFRNLGKILSGYIFFSKKSYFFHDIFFWKCSKKMCFGKKWHEIFFWTRYIPTQNFPKIPKIALRRPCDQY